GAAPEDHPLLGVPIEDRLHRVLDREDEAGRALWALLEANVEPNGRVERRHLVQQDVGELVLEGLRALLAGKVATLDPPAGNRAGDPADHLLDRALPRGVAGLAAEVLLGDDVGRVLRPGLRELNFPLLERHAIAVADMRVAQLPLHGIERMLAGRREQTL